MFTIVASNKDTKEDIINEIIKIENEVYEESMRGDYKSIKARFYKYPEMFFLAYIENKIVGYFCFFPISQKLYEDIVCKKEFRDSDIIPEDIVPFEETSHIYALSIAILKNYQNLGIGKALMDNFENFIGNKKLEGYDIEDIIATVVSKDGEKCAIKNGFELCHDVWDEKGYKIYIKRIPKLQ